LEQPVWLFFFPQAGSDRLAMFCRDAGVGVAMITRVCYVLLVPPAAARNRAGPRARRICVQIPDAQSACSSAVVRGITAAKAPGTGLVVDRTT
jgi:hypothetical protein